MKTWGGGLAVALAAGALAVTASGAMLSGASQQPPATRSAAEAAATIAEQSRRLEEQLDTDYPRAEVGRMRDTAEAMRTVIGWNTVFIKNPCCGFLKQSLLFILS